MTTPADVWATREVWDLYEYGRECLRAVFISNCEALPFTPSLEQQEDWIEKVSKQFDELTTYTHGHPDHEYGFAQWAERELRRYG
jgi:hypothetical protein